MEPISHYFYSQRLKLQFWDWGQEGKPPLVLVHGGLDHARNWDWVARRYREHFHVYALDLRGHGNSAQAPGASYSVLEHVLDLSALLDIISGFPVRLVGHSLGGIIVLMYAGIYPDRVRRAISIEGLGFPPGHKIHKPAAQRIRTWIEKIRETEQREPRSYPDPDSAVRRMKEANPHLSDEVARHLTLHGTNWQSDRSLVWKFDNFARIIFPLGHNLEEFTQILRGITCPVQLFWGRESWAPDPEADGRAMALANHEIVRVEGAGHWVHHDRLDLFLAESQRFLLSGE
ncbi:MAG: alpha/beta hydrolase [Bryobacteraceae bacterium]|nr:alpha/beta hydrolase [Bryobacteraceae bacterium]